jgi:hypothetical protein
MLFAGQLYCVDGFAGWDPNYRFKVRVICSRPYHALFMRSSKNGPFVTFSARPARRGHGLSAKCRSYGSTVVGVLVLTVLTSLLVGLGKAKEFDADLKELTSRLYAFRPYHAPTWTDINKAATQQDRGHFFSPGLVIGVNHQRMAEAMRVKISRSDLLGQSVFVLVHFCRAVPDQGRKTLQSPVMELAQEAADAAIQYLLKQGGLLKPAGEKTTSAQREVERGHEDWTDNVKAHAKDHEL